MWTGGGPSVHRPFELVSSLSDEAAAPLPPTAACRHWFTPIV